MLYSSSMRCTYLGISPFFHIDAEGHYERVHLALLNAVQLLVNDPNSNHHYFGAADCPQHPQSQGLVDADFKRPDGKIAFRKILKLSRDLERLAQSRSIFIHIYEGSVSFLLAVKILHRRGVNVKAIVNLHQIELFRKLFEDPFVKRAYQLIICQKIESRRYFTITSESLMSSILLGKQLELEFGVFPIFSTFSNVKSSVESDRPNLILFSGDLDEHRMIKDLEGISVSGAESVILDSRLFSSASVDFRNFLQSKQYRVIDQRVSEKVYEEIFRSAKKVWFLYRAEINTLGSSGRLMDALRFGLEVCVPARSSLANFALDSDSKVTLIDMNDLSLHLQQDFFESQIKGVRAGNNTPEFAAKELLKMWDAISTVQQKRNIKLFGANNSRSNSESLLSIYLQWFFLQISLRLRGSRKLNWILLKFTGEKYRCRGSEGYDKRNFDSLE
jgi:hypothetical protein